MRNHGSRVPEVDTTVYDFSGENKGPPDHYPTGMIKEDKEALVFLKQIRKFNKYAEGKSHTIQRLIRRELRVEIKYQLWMLDMARESFGG